MKRKYNNWIWCDGCNTLHPYDGPLTERTFEERVASAMAMTQQDIRQSIIDRAKRRNSGS